MPLELTTRSASVKTAYEANDDTNAFTDTEKAALALWPATTVDYLTGAITVASHLARLTSVLAGAYTLAAPTSGQEGVTLIITAGTEAAHVVTATNLIHDGVVGGAKDTATFAAFLGATITLRAVNQLWHVVANNNVTVAGA